MVQIFYSGFLINASPGFMNEFKRFRLVYFLKQKRFLSAWGLLSLEEGHCSEWEVRRLIESKPNEEIK